MNPEEVLEKATALLMSEEFEPIIIQTLTNANDVAVGAATLVYPIIFRLMQETDTPQEELLGSEEGDGIAIYLLTEVFDLTTEAGLLPEPQEGDPEARALAERAVEILGDLLSQAGGAIAQAGGQGAPPAPEAAPPEGPPQPRGLMRGGV